jgi:hypothetical protein
MRLQTKFMYIFLGAVMVSLSACSSSPMKYRLDNNFVYQCSLELIDEDVPAGEAEKVCTASHRAEMLEAGIKERAAPAREPAMVGAATPGPAGAGSAAADRAPASLPPPVILSE